MIVLGVDSSAKSAGVAAVEDGRILGENFINNGLTHSQTLLPMVQHLLDTLGVTMEQVGLIAVNNGPGSFTGIRIGVAMAKGLAFAHDTPCMGVSTLLSLAGNYEEYDGVLCPVMDARCQQVYNAMFTAENGRISRLCPDRAIGFAALAEELKKIEKNVIFIGDGAALCYNEFKDRLPNVRIAPEQLRFARGSSVAKAALAHAESGQVSSFDLIPTYLRPSQAERERAQRQKAD